MKRKPIKKKRKVVSNQVASLKREIETLVSVVQTLSNKVYATQRTISDMRFQRPPAENIRVVTQKTVEEPKTEFDKVLNSTTDQVNQLLNSLDEPTLQEIINSAITGRPVPEKSDIKRTADNFTDWLNQNIPTVNTQDNVWNSIEQAKVIAGQRNATRAIEAKQFTKDFIAAAKDSKSIQEAMRLADTDTAKSQTEIDLALGKK